MKSVNLVRTDRGKLDTGDILIAPCNVNYYYITTDLQAKEAVEEIIQGVTSESFLAIDLETTGFDPFINNIVTVQVGTHNDYQYIFDLRKIDKTILVPIFHLDCWKLGHNIKFDGKFIKTKFGVSMSRYFDTYIAEMVLRAGTYSGIGYSLDALISHRLNKELTIEIVRKFRDDVDEKIKSAKKQMQESFPKLADHGLDLTEAQLVYAAQDVAVGTIFELARDQLVELNISKPNTLFDSRIEEEYVEPKLREEYFKMFPKTLSLWPTADLEFKFIEVLVDMELEGLRFCKETHKEVMANIYKDYKLYRNKFLTLMSKTSKQLTLLGTASVNPDSNKQVLKSLNELLDGTDLDIYDTKAETVETLLLSLEEGTHEYEVVKNLTGYRKMAKLVNSYDESLSGKVHPVTGKIHTSVQQIKSTGRVSMSDPNIQQLPREVPWVKTGDPEKDKEIDKRNGLRECFIAGSGRRFLIYDYNAQEMRIAASISLDQLMLKAFKEDKDLHSFSATLMYNEDYEEFYKKVKNNDKEAKSKRNEAKVVSFGSLYGSGPPNLAKKLRVAMDKAINILKLYWQSYPELAKAMVRYGRLANLHGYSNTVLGRRRYYTDKTDRIKWIKYENNPKAVEAIVKKLKLKWLLEKPIDDSNIEYVKGKLIQRHEGSIAREAGNHHIQGTGADTMKAASILIRKEFQIQDVDACIVALVHDEIIVEAAEELEETVKSIIENKMIEAMTMFCPNVPIKVDGKTSSCWVK